jgi:hypothetical protein
MRIINQLYYLHIILVTIVKVNTLILEVRETVANGEIALVYILTAKQQADGFTKALTLQTHQTLCLSNILVQYVFPEHFH